MSWWKKPASDTQITHGDRLWLYILAAIIMLLFLRSWRATLIVSLAIPVSVVGWFEDMAALGR